MTDAVPRKDVPDAPEAGGAGAPDADEASPSPRTAAAAPDAAEPAAPAAPVVPAAAPAVPEFPPAPAVQSLSALAAATLAQSAQSAQPGQDPPAGAQATPPEPSDQAPEEQDQNQNHDQDQNQNQNQNGDPADQTPEDAAESAVIWSANQPAPAPWFLGRPGQAPPPGWTAGPPPTMPPGSGRPPYQQPGGPPGPPQPGDRAPQQPDRPPGYPPNRRQQPPREPVRPGEQPKRPPLSLKTRWARGLAMGGAICTLLAVLYGYSSFPTWMIGAGVGLCLAVAGLWVGAFAQREAAREGRRAPDAIASIVWCVISSVISLGIIAYSVALYPQLQQYSRCMQTSNTVSEQSACLQQLQKTWPFGGNTAGKPAGL